MLVQTKRSKRLAKRQPKAKSDQKTGKKLKVAKMLAKAQKAC